MTRSTRTPADVPRAVTDAREHLSALRRCIDTITEADLLLDAGQSETPDRTPKRITGPALWEPSRRGTYAAWQQAWRHLADAHRLLLDDTDVPAGWLHPIADVRDKGSRAPAHLSQRVTHGQARAGIALMEAMLDWVDSPDLLPPEANAALGACDEIADARHVLAPHAQTAPGGEDPPECANEGCTASAEPRGDGRWRPECAACRKHRQRTGRARRIAA